jgi:hypothetical protein
MFGTLRDQHLGPNLPYEMRQELFLVISTYHAKQPHWIYQNIWPVSSSINVSSSDYILVDFHKFNMSLHANDLTNFHTQKIQRIKLGIDKVAEI